MAATRNTKQKDSQSKFTRRRKILFWGIFVVCACFVYSIVGVQIEIYKQKKTLNAIDGQIEQQQLENDELLRVVTSEDEKEIIERIAREKLGYAAYDERVFVDVAGAEDNK